MIVVAAIAATGVSCRLMEDTRDRRTIERDVRSELGVDVNVTSATVHYPNVGWRTKVSVYVHGDGGTDPVLRHGIETIVRRDFHSTVDRLEFH